MGVTWGCEMVRERATYWEQRLLGLRNYKRSSIASNYIAAEARSWKAFCAA